MPPSFHRLGESGSDVRAHFTDGVIKGTVALDNETYYFQPAQLHGMESTAGTHVVFPASAVRGNTQGGKTCGVADSSHDTHDHDDLAQLQAEVMYSAQRYNRQRRGFQGDPEKNTCEMALVADHRFFADSGQGSIATTANV